MERRTVLTGEASTRVRVDETVVSEGFRSKELSTQLDGFVVPLNDLSFRRTHRTTQRHMTPSILRIAVEGLLAFAAALGLVLILELGDKTQLATISLATRAPWTRVLAGAAVGLVAVTAIGAAIGGLLAAYLEAWLGAIQIGGGVLFIGFGAWTYLRREEEGGLRVVGKGAFSTAFLLNFVAELGDKTQLAVVFLAAAYRAPASVFAGASLALVAIAATSVGIGSGLARVLQARSLRLASTALFIGAGALLILEAALFP